MSVLRPETRAVLRGVHAADPVFPNMIAAELFDVAHTRGDLKLIPYLGGGYVVFDASAPFGRGVVELHPDLGKAQAALERLAAKR